LSLCGIMRRSAVIILALMCVLPNPTLARSKVKLVVWGLQSSEESAGLRAQVVEFERRNPRVKVSILGMGAGQMNPQKLMTSIVGKTPPDLINQDRFTIGDWASRDTFMDLTPFIKRDRNKPDGIRPEDYYQPCWKEANYRGKVYAIPNSTDDRILFYNKTLFREAGLDPNKPPATWSELREYAVRLTKRDKSGAIKQIGFIPNWGNSWLYLYSWQNGGEFMSPDGRTCTMDNKRSIEALEFMVSVYDALGGAKQVDQFQAGFQGGAMDPFITGKVAMKIDCENSHNIIARFNPDLDFGVAPAPVPDWRYKKAANNVVFDKNGVPLALPPTTSRLSFPRYLTWSGGFSWAIPVGAKHPELAWKFVKWMNSPEAGLVGARAQIAYNRSKGRPYVPLMHANMRVNEAVFKAYAPKEPKFRNSLRFALSMMPYSRFRPVTFVGQQLWDEHVRAFDRAMHHEETRLTAEQAMREGTKVVQRELDRVFGREHNPLIPMWVLWVAIVTAILGLVTCVIALARRGEKVGSLMRREAWAGYAFASPWIIGFLVFTIGPIVASIVFSFCDYDVIHPPRWVGLGNYHGLLTYDWPLFSKALYNAGFLAVIGLPLGLVTGLAIAMLLNTNVKGTSWYRTLYYLPSIVPVVASAVLWLWVLNPQFGIVNAAWSATLTRWFGIKPPGWISQPGEFFGIAAWLWQHTLGCLGIGLPGFLANPPSYLGAKSALITMGLWGAGGGMIIWLAGLKGIPTSYYEAAEIDGASKWARFRHVTLPMLSPYIFFNLIMGAIGVLQAFDNIYVMTGGTGGPVDATLVPVLYLFNKAFRYFSMGYASALAWIMFAVVLAITLVQLKLAPRWVHYEGEKGK
jgi:ABC-type sugar transport system permease subunit/ABC-type glycerol-3-phosphate transport system substrate-binding protein